MTENGEENPDTPQEEDVLVRLYRRKDSHRYGPLGLTSTMVRQAIDNVLKSTKC